MKIENTFNVTLNRDELATILVGLRELTDSTYHKLLPDDFADIDLDVFYEEFKYALGEQGKLL